MADVGDAAELLGVEGAAFHPVSAAALREHAARYPFDAGAVADELPSGALCVPSLCGITLSHKRRLQRPPALTRAQRAERRKEQRARFVHFGVDVDADDTPASLLAHYYGATMGAPIIRVRCEAGPWAHNYNAGAIDEDDLRANDDATECGDDVSDAASALSGMTARSAASSRGGGDADDEGGAWSDDEDDAAMQAMAWAEARRHLAFPSRHGGQLTSEQMEVALRADAEGRIAEHRFDRLQSEAAEAKVNERAVACQRVLQRRADVRAARRAAVRGGATADGASPTRDGSAAVSENGCGDGDASRSAPPLPPTLVVERTGSGDTNATESAPAITTAPAGEDGRSGAETPITGAAGGGAAGAAMPSMPASRAPSASATPPPEPVPLVLAAPSPKGSAESRPPTAAATPRSQQLSPVPDAGTHSPTAAAAQSRSAAASAGTSVEASPTPCRSCPSPEPPCAAPRGAERGECAAEQSPPTPPAEPAVAADASDAHQKDDLGDSTTRPAPRRRRRLQLDDAAVERLNAHYDERLRAHADRIRASSRAGACFGQQGAVKGGSDVPFVVLPILPPPPKPLAAAPLAAASAPSASSAEPTKTVRRSASPTTPAVATVPLAAPAAPTSASSAPESSAPKADSSPAQPTLPLRQGAGAGDPAAEPKKSDAASADTSPADVHRSAGSSAVAETEPRPIKNSDGGCCIVA